MPQAVLLLPPGTEVPGTPIHPVEENGTEDRVAAPVRVLLVEDEILTALDIEHLVQQLGSVRSQGSLPRAPPADRFRGPL
jgi:hypothetical protein